MKPVEIEKEISREIFMRERRGRERKKKTELQLRFLENLGQDDRSSG